MSGYASGPRVLETLRSHPEPRPETLEELVAISEETRQQGIRQRYIAAIRSAERELHPYVLLPHIPTHTIAVNWYRARLLRTVEIPYGGGSCKFYPAGLVGWVKRNQHGRGFTFYPDHSGPYGVALGAREDDLEIDWNREHVVRYRSSAMVEAWDAEERHVDKVGDLDREYPSGWA